LRCPPAVSIHHTRDVARHLTRPRRRRVLDSGRTGSGPFSHGLLYCHTRPSQPSRRTPSRSGGGIVQRHRHRLTVINGRLTAFSAERSAHPTNSPLVRMCEVERGGGELKSGSSRSEPSDDGQLDPSRPRGSAPDRWQRPCTRTSPRGRPSSVRGTRILSTTTDFRTARRESTGRLDLRGAGRHGGELLQCLRAGEQSTAEAVVRQG
jgi:hypothetical protein